LTFGIIYFSNQSNISTVIKFNIWDKAQHCFFYVLYGISLLLHFYSTESIKKEKFIYTYTLIIGSLFGASDEFHQHFIPGRSVEIEDWIADVIGVVISLLFAKVIGKFVKRKLAEVRNQ